MKRIEVYESLIFNEDNYLIKVKIQCSNCLSNNLKYIENGNLTIKFFYCKFCGHLMKKNDKKISEVINKEIKKKMDIPVEKSLSIEDGLHEGEIVDLQQRDYGTYSYLDVVVTVDKLKKEDGNPITLKVGFPLPATDKSSLGKFLELVGFELVEGETIKNVEKKLIGINLSYQTVEQKGKDGNMYSNVMKESIKVM